jgi:hypothetical protein
MTLRMLSNSIANTLNPHLRKSAELGSDGGEDSGSGRRYKFSLLTGVVDRHALE